MRIYPGHLHKSAGHRFLYHCLSLLLALGCCSVQQVHAQTVSRSIYEDSPAAFWENWSWGSTINLANATPVQAGRRSIAVTYNSGWGGLYLHHSGLPIIGYSHLQFWIHGGAGGRQQIYVYAEDQSGRTPVQVPLSRYLQGGVVAPNAWRLASIPLADLGLTTAPLTGLTWQNDTNGSQGTFYLDTIRLVGNGTTPTPTPRPGATPTPRPTVAPQPTPAAHRRARSPPPSVRICCSGSPTCRATLAGRWPAAFPGRRATPTLPAAQTPPTTGPTGTRPPDSMLPIT